MALTKDEKSKALAILQANNKKETRKRIINLLGKIDTQIIEWDTTDSQNLHELRKRIFLVHAIADRHIDTLALDYLFRTIQPEHIDVSKVTEKDWTGWSDIIGSIIDAMDEMKFKQKLVFTKKLGAIKQDIFLLFDEFNTLRNKLGHPKPGSENLKKYSNDESYLEALELTSKVVNVCSKFGFSWFDEIDAKMKGTSHNHSSEDEPPF